MKVLIVEDEVEFIEIMKVFCEGWELRIAQTLEGALDRLKYEVFDLIVADLSLPDSYQPISTFAHLHHAAMNVPLIVVTGSTNEGTGMKLKELGAADFIFKDRITWKTFRESVCAATGHCDLKPETTLRQISGLTRELVRQRING